MNPVVVTNQMDDRVTGAKKLSFLDEARGVAVLMVILFHCLGAAMGSDRIAWSGMFRDLSFRPGMKSWLLLSPLTFGYLGVAIFFVISGFCIHLSFSRLKVENPWREFFHRRVFRILPPYYAWLAIFVILGLVLPHQFTSGGGVKQIVAHMLLIHNWHSSTFFGINCSFWSLAVEWQLYLLYPILMIAVQKWSWRNTLVMLGIIEITFRFPWSMLFGHTSDLELQPWLDFPFAYWWSWAIGAWIAYDWLADRRLPLAHLPIWLPVIATIICWEFRPLNNYTFMTGALAMAVWLSQKLEAKFVNTASHRSSQFKVLVSRFCIVVGGWSYSLYLLHQPFINLISRLYQREILVHGIVLLGMTFFTTLLITIPMAWFSYKWIELPGIELGKQN